MSSSLLARHDVGMLAVKTVFTGAVVALEKSTRPKAVSWFRTWTPPAANEPLVSRETTVLGLFSEVALIANRGTLNRPAPLPEKLFATIFPALKPPVESRATTEFALLKGVALMADRGTLNRPPPF